jgi:homocysteine S-methyltransferase
METSLLFGGGFELPCFAAFPLLAEPRGRAALGEYFEPFLDLARKRGLPFVLDTPTWRANPDWGAQLGYGLDELAAAIRDAVAFARDLAAGRSDVAVNGVVDPRGDGYVVGKADDRRRGDGVLRMPDTHPARLRWSCRSRSRPTAGSGRDVGC